MDKILKEKTTILSHCHACVSSEKQLITCLISSNVNLWSPIKN